MGILKSVVLRRKSVDIDALLVADLGLLEHSGNLLVIASQIDDLMRLPLLNTILKLINFACTVFVDDK
jgi:hypothetical protein